MGNTISNLQLGGERRQNQGTTRPPYEACRCSFGYIRSRTNSNIPRQRWGSEEKCPGKRALRFERSVRVDTDSAGSPGVEQAVDAFFGIGDEGGSAKRGALNGFKAVVKTGLKQILGDTSAGEDYDKKFFVCIKHNAITRVDMFTYRYNFANEGVISTHKNVLAYILCTSVVDHNDLTVDEMVYLASEFAGDGRDQYEMYLNGLIQVWKNLRVQDMAVKAGPPMPNLAPLAPVPA